ncbi:MAG: hypothetical protein QMD77_01990 [Patescibacteria group bacterium]|nr:hypothetical protein [Patescibacteria group bacterium]
MYIERWGGGDEPSDMTEEFSEESDEAAREVFDQRVKSAEAARGKYLCTDKVLSLHRIDQREKLTKIC